MPIDSEVLQSIFDNSPVMISFSDRAGRLLHVNREWERTLGWTQEDALKRDILTELYPDPRDLSAVRTFVRGAGRQWVDFRPRTKDGRILETSWLRLELSDGSRIGFGIDLTGRRRAEEALAESEVRFAKVFQVSPIALGMSSIADGRIIDANASWLELFGYQRHEVIGRTNAELNISVDQGLRQALVDRVRKESVVRNVEMQVRLKSGEIRDTVVSAVPIDLEGGDAFWISSMLDITDRKRAEAERDALLEREQAARADAEAALERLRAIQSITEPALSLLALNHRLSEMLARLSTALRAGGASVLLPNQDHSAWISRAIHGIPVIDKPVSVDSPAGRLFSQGRAVILNGSVTDADPAWASWSAESGLRSAMVAPLIVEGRTTGAVVVAAVDDRQFSQEDLHILRVVADRIGPTVERARLVLVARAAHERVGALSRRLLTAQEEERRRVAVELHDDLGQLLTAAKINLETAERSSTGPALGPLHEAIGCVDQAMQRVRELALDLRPSVLDDLGLAAALRWFLDRFSRKTPLGTHFSIDAMPKLDAALEITCFRLAQEALTNVARHAHARHVWFDLHLLDETLELSIRDDGIGFDVTDIRARAIGGASMGLIGMEERASLAGAEFEIASVPGSGTVVRARFALSENTVSP